METFKAGLKLAEDNGEYITLGGGEPTIHPDFWAFLGLSLGAMPEECGVHIITNGTETETALHLLNMGKRGIIGIELSLNDGYHNSDLVSPQVKAAFLKERHNGYQAHIRSVKQIAKMGRGRNIYGSKAFCVCDDLFLDPDGVLFACGCRKEKFGTIFSPEIPENYWRADDKCTMKKDERPTEEE
jgi:hypothetical protein